MITTRDLVAVRSTAHPSTGVQIEEQGTAIRSAQTESDAEGKICRDKFDE